MHACNSDVYSNFVESSEIIFLEMENWFTRQAAMLYQSYCLDDLLKVQKAQQNATLKEIGLPSDLQNIVVSFSKHKLTTAKLSAVTLVQKSLAKYIKLKLNCRIGFLSSEKNFRKHSVFQNRKSPYRIWYVAGKGKRATFRYFLPQPWNFCINSHNLNPPFRIVATSFSATWEFRLQFL